MSLAFVTISLFVDIKILFPGTQVSGTSEQHVLSTNSYWFWRIFHTAMVAQKSNFPFFLMCNYTAINTKEAFIEQGDYYPSPK